MTTGYPSMSSHSTHPSLDGFHHPHHHPHLPPHLQPAHPHGGQTCVPSLIPPGVDPATVDIRTFYPYQPNEVKHRKRTTRPQLKVLEGVYEHDTKPNALLRKKLAEELGMTPRGVQVWFQNRRAKEKNQAKKLDAGTGTIGSGSSSTSAAGSSPSKADGTTTSEGESSTASASKVGSPENAAADVHNSSSPEIPSTSSSAETVRRTSLPTVPVIPALDSASLADGSSAVTSANDISSSPGVPGSSYPAAHMVRGSNPSAAEILAQRRPSLPILNFASSSSHGLRRMPSNLSGRVPKGFDPNERRKSVDTMSANMQRLSTHPYARQAAQYTNASGHGHSGFVYPHGLNARRSISQSAGLSSVEDGPEDGAFAAFTAQQAANGRSYYLSPTQAHGQNQSRPMLTQRTSMPSFHQSQQQLSPPSAATNGSFAGQPFTDPWGSPSQSQQSAPSVVDTPISPHTHALPPPSPGASAPPPISQSYSNPMLNHSLSRRYPPAGHGRPIPAPVPGPLPDAHFSFGLPASGPSSNGSSSSTSPVANDNGLGLMSRGSVVLEEEDDASAVSSTYDPTSRFGSFASVASTESWTSAHYSDIDRRKLSISAPDGFDDQRRGSIASGYLPQLFGEMDVNSGNTPQPMSDGVAPDQSHPDPTRRGSSGSGSLHEPQEYSDAYAPQDVYDPSLQHDQYAPNDQSPYTQTPPQTEPYVADNGSYSPSSTISARSQSVAGAKSINEHTHSVSPPMPQRSSTSELMYALHHSNPAENLNNNSELSYPTEYNTSLSNPSDHHLSAHHVHTQYDQLSVKPDQYNSHQYSQQTDTYEMPQSHMQPAYSPPSMEYGYQMYQDPSLYHNGAVEIGSVCVPASMDSMNMGDYLAP